MDGQDLALDFFPWFMFFNKRIGHSLKTVGKLNLSRNNNRIPFSDLLGEPRLVEAGSNDQARIINKRHLSKRQFWTNSLDFHFINLSCKRALCPNLRTLRSNHFRHVDITQWVTLQQITNSTNAHRTSKSLRTRGTHLLHGGNRRVKRQGSMKAVGACATNRLQRITCSIHRHVCRSPLVLYSTERTIGYNGCSPR